MLPPWASGVIVIRASNAAGATPTVPCIGSIGRSTVNDERLAWKRTSRAVRSSSYSQTRSSSGGWRVAVCEVEVSAPKCGNVLDTAQSRAGSMAAKCSASVSPGSAPSTWNGPLTGFRYGNCTTVVGRSPGPRTLPPKQSSVDTRRTSPGLTRATAGRPPKVYANSSAVGRYSRTSGIDRLLQRLAGQVGPPAGRVQHDEDDDPDAEPDEAERLRRHVRVDHHVQQDQEPDQREDHVADPVAGAVADDVVPEHRHVQGQERGHGAEVHQRRHERDAVAPGVHVPAQGQRDDRADERG